jgi:hypothetical protein
MVAQTPSTPDGSVHFSSALLQLDAGLPELAGSGHAHRASAKAATNWHRLRVKDDSPVRVCGDWACGGGG